MVPELKLTAALADDSGRVSEHTSPMNFTNEQDMLVQRLDSSPSMDKTNDSPYKLVVCRKKSKYEDNMQQHIIPEQEEPSSTLLFDHSDVRIVQQATNINITINQPASDLSTSLIS
jgi:hypothetical protein